MNWIRFLLFSTQLAFLIDCTGTDATHSSHSDSILPDCVTNGSCNISSCDKEICKQIARTLVQVEIEPSAFSGSVGQQHLNVALGDLIGEGLELKPTVTLTGTMSKAHSEIIAIPIVHGELNNHHAHLNPVDAKGQFAIKLVSQEEYLLIANPTGRFDLAPRFVRVKLSADSQMDLPLSSKGVRISGLLKYSASVSPAELGDRVWIRVMQGERQVSSLAKINEDGEFSVILAHPLFDEHVASQPLELVVQPTQDTSYIPTKRIRLSGDFTKDLHVGVVDLSLSPFLITAQFHIKNVNNEAVKDARIIVRSLVPMGFLQTSTISDENGDGTIFLPSGRYDVAVVPRQDDSAQFRKLKNMDFFDSTPLEIRLEPRGTLSSTIFDAQGSPVKGARMLLTRFARADSDAREAILDSAELRLEARSDEEGRWCLLGFSLLAHGCQPIRLDSGRYRLSVIPPEGSRYPHFTRVFDFPEISEIAIVLKDAILLNGRILAPKTRTPVPNSFVRIYSRDLEKESGNPIFLGQAFSGSDGSFSIVMPQEYVLAQMR